MRLELKYQHVLAVAERRDLPSTSASCSSSFELPTRGFLAHDEVQHHLVAIIGLQSG